VFSAILSLLKSREEPVSLADQTRGLINTTSINVTNVQLRTLVSTNLLTHVGRQPGRYLLSFNVKRLDDRSIEVIATTLVVVDGPVASILGGQALASNGSLERAHLTALAQMLGLGH